MDSGNYRPQFYGWGTESRFAWTSGQPAILRVTNLNDAGEGSFRAALEYMGPAVVLFDAGGLIHLSSPITCNNSELVIAGQMAPSPVCVAHFEMQFYGQNVLVQHIYFRLGLNPDDYASDNQCGYLTGRNIVMDHCTFTWSAHSCIGNAGASNESTLWRCVIAEGFNTLRQLKSNDQLAGDASFDGHARGAYAQNYSVHTAWIECLFAHQLERNPYTKGGASSYMASSLIYNPGDQATHFMDPDASGVGIKANLINCHYRPGANTTAGLAAVMTRHLDGQSQVHVSGLLIEEGMSEFYAIDGADPRVGSLVAEAVVPGYTPIAASDVMNHIIANVGPWPAKRDSRDAALMGEVSNRTGNQIKHQDEVGGWPAYEAKTQTLNPPADPHAVAPGQAFRTNMEMWLESYALAAEGGSAPPPTNPNPEPPPVDPPPVTGAETVYQIGANSTDPQQGAEDTTILKQNGDGFYDTQNLYVTKYADNDVGNGLLRFDLSHIPAASSPKITNVVLHVYLYEGVGGEVVVSLRCLQKHWVRGEATWNSASGQPWEVPGATGNSDVWEVMTTSVLPQAAGVWVEFTSPDVIAATKDLVAGAVPNEGFHLERVDGANDGRYHTIIGSLGPDGQRPYLVVTVAGGGGELEEGYEQEGEPGSRPPEG